MVRFQSNSTAWLIVNFLVCELWALRSNWHGIRISVWHEALKVISPNIWRQFVKANDLNWLCSLRFFPRLLAAAWICLALWLVQKILFCPAAQNLNATWELGWILSLSKVFNSARFCYLATPNFHVIIYVMRAPLFSHWCEKSAQIGRTTFNFTYFPHDTQSICAKVKSLSTWDKVSSSCIPYLNQFIK